MTEKEQHVNSPFENYEKAAFQLALHEIALEEADQARPEGKEGEDFEKTCLESTPRMMKVIDRYTRRASRIRFARDTLPKIGKAAAAAALVAFLGGAIAIASSKTIRVSVVDFLISKTPEYTAVGFRQTEDVIDVPENWASSYYPSYIPAGFSIEQVNIGHSMSEVVFLNEESEVIHVLFGGTATEMRADSEGAQITHVTINGADATLITKDDSNKLIGRLGDEYYLISAVLPADELVKIAESIKLIAH